MNYDSNQNQGYEPKMSSGNNSGYYMGESNSLMNMLQTGGQPSSAGAAAFAQAMQGQRDQKRFDQISREEAERQKRGGLFGSVAGLAGQGLGFLLGGSAGAAAGKTLGTGLGQSLGAGKAKSYDTSGTVFGQQKFKNVNQASRDYSKGILGRSLLAGGESLAASYLSPGGFKGAPRKGIASTGTLGLSQPPVLGGSPDAFGSSSPFLSRSLSGSKSALSSGTLNAIPSNSFSMPPSSLFGMSTPNSSTDSYFDPSSLSPYLSNYEDGGLINYMHGGVAHDDDSYSAAGILGQQGLDPTEEQLKLFQSFDPTKIQQAKTGAEQSLMSMTGGMGLSSAGGGFGAKQRAATSAIGAGQDLIGDTTEQAQKSFESQTLGTAADLVAGGAEFGSKAEDRTYVPTDNPNWSPPTVSDIGAPYSFDGKTYYWDGNEWTSQYVYDEDQRAQYDDGNDGYGGS